MKTIQKLADFLTLLLLTGTIIVFSLTIYVHYLWTDLDFEQLLIMLRDISLNVIIKNAHIKDYAYAFLFFLCVYPVCYLYFNTKGRFYISLTLLGLILYFSGFVPYFIYSHTTSKLYEKEYVYPKQIKFTFPEKKRNLILIYLESFEQNFTKAEHYEKNLIPHLGSLWNEGEYSLKHQTMFGTDFSIASLVSSHCGIPLRYIHIDDIYALKFFLPQAVCFPEILHQNGYQTAIIKAADVTFTRVDVFAKSHGYDEALGVHEILPTYPKEMHASLKGTFGGVTDETLFSFAKEKLSQFSKDKPFMLTLFSLDTHTPAPHHNPKCSQVFGDIRDVYMCSDKTVYDFVTWLKSSPYWENTTVVLMGDHLFPSRMKTKGRPHRGIYNVFLNLPEGLKIDKNKVFTTFDMAPTILEALGIHFQERAFGLGRSLFASNDTLIKRMGLNTFKVQLKNLSEVYKIFNTLPQKRTNLFTPYMPGTKLSGDDFKTYSDSYDEILGHIYLDRLNLELPKSKVSKYKVDLKFNAIVNWDSKLIISANGKKVYTFKFDYKQKNPVTVSFDIPAELIKNGKLQLFFKNTGGLTAATLMGINPIEMTLSEK